jgi:DNA-binding MarR family transcriptional regulator
MSDSAPVQSADNDRIVLGLLESVERDGAQSQRRLAADLGIALGLVNAYIKRCVKKGLMKVADAPARRYAYYLTPQGLAEKSRLTVEYLSVSFSFFRSAKADCARIFDKVQGHGFKRVALAGVSDLAEIAAICALESRVEIVGIVDPVSTLPRFIGVQVFQSFDDVSGLIDAIIVTDLSDAARTAAHAAKHLEIGRVFIPALLGVRAVAGSEATT